MAENFEQDANDDVVAHKVVAWLNMNSYSPNNLSIQTQNDAKQTQEDIINPEDFYDKSTQSNESQETYAPLKIYKVNKEDIWNVGFGHHSEPSNEKAKYQLSFAVNWPLIKKGTTTPVWWYIDNGVQKWAFIDPMSLPEKDRGNFAVRNWIFGLWKDWKLHLIPYEEYNPKSISFQWAIQNWPILVQNGVNKSWSSPTMYNRSGIWFTPQWEAIVIYSDKPITTRDFSELFVQQWCTNAIYLDWWELYAGYQDNTGKHWHLNPEATKLQFYTLSSK